MERLDKMLYTLGLARSRNHAQEMIHAGRVLVSGLVISRPSFLVKKEDHEIGLVEDIPTIFKYVGRGAAKIAGAINDFSISVQDLIVADVGASTGGFTDFLLDRGAAKIYAIDVGHGQLAQTLRENLKVINLEGVNVKYPYELQEKVDLAVVDLSYISLKLTLPTVASFLKENGEIVALVKPQFEVGLDAIGKGGIVKDRIIIKQTIKDLVNFCEQQKLAVLDFTKSAIKGKTGNQEYFFYLQKSGSEIIEEAHKKDIINKIESLI